MSGTIIARDPMLDQEGRSFSSLREWAKTESKPRASGPTRADPTSVPVPDISRDVRVKIASTADEWEQAFQLVSARYQGKGYSRPGEQRLHFTLFHALPDTMTFVALEQARVVATVSLVPDNVVLGLPMETIYADEISRLRRAARRLGEITCLANADLPLRQSIPVQMHLCRLMMQCSARQGSAEWVIAVNPRHVGFYRKVWGFVPIGPRKACPAVEGAPAEALFVDSQQMHDNAPETYDFVFGNALPVEALTPVRIPAALSLQFASHSTRTDLLAVDQLLRSPDVALGPRRW